MHFRFVIFLALISGGRVANAASRAVIPFDFGWKHRTGLHKTADPSAPPIENPDPGTTPPESAANFDDKDWMSVQLPHDALIGTNPGYANSTACPDGCSGKSFIPRHVLWYRKKFNVPEDWQSSSFWLDFQGSFRETTVWINGELVASHDCGYTPFRIRLDNISSISFEKENLVTVFVDPDNGDEGANDHASGWWYEGGGLYRHVNLVRASPFHIAQDGLFVYSNVTESEATVHASVDVANDGDSAYHGAYVVFTATDAKGNAVGSARADLSDVATGSITHGSASFTVSNPIRWTSSSPTMYVVDVTVYDSQGAIVDSQSARHGFRTLRYDADHGFFLNEKHFKVRGFCDHNNFGVVGMAVPERVKLFRAQALRSTGGNGRRMSHNPPDPLMLDIYDRLGTVVMDENRLFANSTKYVANMGAMVRRDRNHPSVVIWSFCNEAGCEGDRETGGPSFREITYAEDGSRPVLANMFTFADLLSDTIDVQGFSHQDRAKLEACHEKLPNKPIFMSEWYVCFQYRDFPPQDTFFCKRELAAHRSVLL